MEEMNPIDMPEIRHALVAAGVSHQTLGHWRVRGVPLERCAPLEVLTNKVATRQILRPHDWMVHWPELAKPETEPPIAGVSVADCAMKTGANEAQNAGGA